MIRILLLSLLLAGCSNRALVIPDPVERYNTIRISAELQQLVISLSPRLQQALARHPRQRLTKTDSLTQLEFRQWLTGEFFLACHIPEVTPPARLLREYKRLSYRTWYPRHILFSDTVAAAAAWSALRLGADFDSLASCCSLDPGSAALGGALPPTHVAETVFPFEQALTRLQPGELSPPVATSFGWHLIRLDSLADCDTSFKSEEEIVSHLRRSLHVKATRRYLADLYHKYNVVILADSWSSSAPVASWDERHQLPAPQSTCFVPERGEPFLPGRRCITGTSLDSLLLQAFIGKIDPDSFDDSFRRDFLKHYLERELLYREAVATRFCETSAIKEALQQQQVISQATATLRCLLPVAEYPVNNGNPTEERLWQLLSAD